MPPAPRKTVAKLSILDRLLLDENWETNRTAEQINRQVRESVRRDLEMLFNSRPRYLSWPSALSELDTSCISYGVPDPQTMQIASPAQREGFRKMMEASIRRYETRLDEVAVEIPEGSDELDRTLRFRIRAVLASDPDGDPIVYDTILDPTARMLSFVNEGRPGEQTPQQG